jgi:hypothetical protein
MGCHWTEFRGRLFTAESWGMSAVGFGRECVVLGLARKAQDMDIRVGSGKETWRDLCSDSRPGSHRLSSRPNRTTFMEVAFDSPLRLCAFAREKPLAFSPDDSAPEEVIFVSRQGAKLAKKSQRRKAADPEALRAARGLTNRSFRRAKVPRRGSIRKRNFKLEGSDINLCRLRRRSDVRCFEGRIGSSSKGGGDIAAASPCGWG